MDASVVIITKNQKPFLQKSLPVLLSQNFKEDYEIIVVDSGSTDGAREYAKSLPVKLLELEPEHFNFAKAFNLGAEKSRGKFLVRLSGDAIPLGKNFISEILKPFKDPRVGGAYGRYTISGRKGWGYPDFWPAIRFPKKLTRYRVKPTFLMGIKPWEYREKIYDFTGGCCAIRRKIWEKRPFNEELIAAEDAEYSWFLHLIGYDIVFNPKVKVIHERKLSKGKVSQRFSKWQLIFWWQILRYWLLRLFFKDPYKELRIG